MNQLTNDLEVLAGLHERGDLSADEFARAKSALLTGTTSAARTPDVSTAQLARIARQNELAQLDREWLMEREKYYVRNQRGSKSLPTEAESLFGGIIGVAFGVCWTLFAYRMGAPVFFPLFGLLFIAVGIGGSIQSYTKARQYKQAKAHYDTRRATLTDDAR